MNFKKFLAFILASVMLVMTVPMASAASEEITADDAAKALNSLGLLAGVGNNADGSINFDLGGSLTRAQSITQVVRFLGAEQAATTSTNAHPFTDLASWAVPYISYAYANGITQGVSATKFDGDSAMSEAAFLTAILRVLGYVDKNDGSGDFVWSDPYTLAEKVGLIKSSAKDTDFRRGDAFIICYNALTATVKSGDKICDKLVKSGVVSAEKMQAVVGTSSTSCPITIGGAPLSSFNIVVSVSANASVKLAANNLATAIEAICGIKPSVMTDDISPSANEIAIGNTTRAISAKVQNLGENDVAVVIEGTSVAISGPSNTIIRRAATFFTDSYIGSGAKAITDADSYVGSLLSNPIRSYGQNGDPCIVYDNETEYYYAVYSAPKNDRVILYRAKTLAGLGQLDTADGKEIYVAGENKEIKHKLYAPELKKMDGKWYIYASGATSMEDKDASASKSIRLFCLEATSSDPYGDYKFKALLDPDIFAIDAHPFTYKGVNYIAFARISSGNIISIAKLSNPWTIDTSKVTVISTAVYDFETQAGHINEGPFTFVSPDGRLFMLYSANNVTSPYYSLGILEFTGSDILSKPSWTKHKTPVFSSTDNIAAPGHCSVFMSPDGTEYWLAYHFQSSGRKLGAQKFTFDETGFPVFGEPISPSTYFAPPSGE